MITFGSHGETPKVISAATAYYKKKFNVKKLRDANSAIYVAEDSSRKQYALKVSPNFNEGDMGHENEFSIDGDEYHLIVRQASALYNEDTILAAIPSHPNIIRRYESFVENGFFVMVIDFFKDGDMFSQPQASEESGRYTAAKLGLAVNHLHKNGFIHRIRIFLI